MSREAVQTCLFSGASHRDAKRERERFEGQCRDAEVLAHRVETFGWQRQWMGPASFRTDYAFTDLSGAWTKAAESAGTLIAFQW